MKAIIIFAIATIINVSLSTIRSLCTIKGGKWLSAITNAVCYGFYPLIVMLTAKGTIDIIINMIITAIVNFVCVWLIKFIEEKTRKDKLWKVEATIDKCYRDDLIHGLSNSDIPFNYIDNVGRYTIFNVFCATQEQSLKVKKYLDIYKAKYFVSESKIL